MIDQQFVWHRKLVAVSLVGQVLPQHHIHIALAQGTGGVELQPLVDAVCVEGVLARQHPDLVLVLVLADADAARQVLELRQWREVDAVVIKPERRELLDDVGRGATPSALRHFHTCLERCLLVHVVLIEATAAREEAVAAAQAAQAHTHGGDDHRGYEVDVEHRRTT